MWREALDTLTSELQALYGPRLQRIVLYGSRARGDAANDSDIDVLVVLDSLGDFWLEHSRISPIAGRISLQYDVVLSIIPVDAREMENPQTPLLVNARREGVSVG